MSKRMLDTSIWANEHFADLPPMGRLLLIGIITLADDQGRCKANPAYLRSQVFHNIDELAREAQIAVRDGKGLEAVIVLGDLRNRAVAGVGETITIKDRLTKARSGEYE